MEQNPSGGIESSVLFTFCAYVFIALGGFLAYQKGKQGKGTNHRKPTRVTMTVETARDFVGKIQAHGVAHLRVTPDGEVFAVGGPRGGNYIQEWTRGDLSDFLDGKPLEGPQDRRYGKLAMIIEAGANK